jgi:hypothetical protein
MKRKHEGFVTFLKLSAVFNVVVGFIMLVPGLENLTSGGIGNNSSIRTAAAHIQTAPTNR